MDTNYNIGKDFLDMPKPHHHVSRLLVLLIILGVIVSAAASSFYLFTPSSVPATAVVQQITKKDPLAPATQLIAEYKSANSNVSAKQLDTLASTFMKKQKIVSASDLQEADSLLLEMQKNNYH